MASISSEDGRYSAGVKVMKAVIAQYSLTMFAVRISQFSFDRFSFEGLRINTRILWRYTQESLRIFLCKDGHRVDHPSIRSNDIPSW